MVAINSGGVQMNHIETLVKLNFGHPVDRQISVDTKIILTF